MHNLIGLIGACQGGVAVPDSTPIEADYASVHFDDDGLPECAASISDEAFCAGWASRYYSEFLDGNPQAPDWLWRFGEPTSVWYAPGLLNDDGAWCADSETEAFAIFERGVGADAGLYDSTDTSDPRWIDVIWDRTTSSWRAFRVPRCTVFSQMADVGSLFESDSGPRTVDPLWTVSTLPADRASFFDLARTLEVYRFASDDGNYDWSIPFAVGSHATDDLWTYRTCRIDTKADFGEDGTYDHRLLQVEYTMQPSVGVAKYTIEIVRRVNCEDPIWQAPDW